MSAPKYVPTDSDGPRSYRSPNVVPRSWSKRRAGSLGGVQPQGAALGHQGPDQGYALVLAHEFDDKLWLAADEHRDDVMAGAVEIAMKRASLFGRAPVVHDIEIALRVWGFLDESPPELVEFRRCFDGLANPHHWRELREVVAMVPERTLRTSGSDVRAAHKADWQATLAVPS